MTDSATAQPVPAPPRPRMVWMDLLRGTAIVLVVLWHSPAILRLYEIDVPIALITVNEFFSPFRMPTLMFLSGMLLPASLRKPTGVYYAGKLRLIAYPFAVWTVIHFFLYRPDTTLLDLHFWTTSYLWFLAYILVYYLGAPLLRWVPTGLAIVTPLLAAPFVHETSRRRFFFLAAFFFLGTLATEHRALFDRAVASRWAWAATPVAVAFGVWTAITAPERYQSIFALFSVAGILVLVKLAQRAPLDGWTTPLQFVGRNSLIFYVTHFPVIILVILVGYDLLHLPVVLVIAIAFVAAFTVGTICVRLADTTVVHWAFVAPRAGDLARFRTARHRSRQARMLPGRSRRSG